MSEELDYEVEVEASHTLNLKLENGDYVVINPFGLIEDMIEDRLGDPMMLLDRLSTLQNMVANEFDEEND